MLKWDHPRMCGEKYHEKNLHERTKGSPPHVRGKVPPPRYSGTWTGITPACAGKSFFRLVVQSVVEDHPRMCGEKKKGGSPEKSGLGSPPHVRGKDHMRGMAADIRGITPACAGKSERAFVDRCDGQDHPRMCGEKLHRLPLYSLLVGSPPHVRGKESGHF